MDINVELPTPKVALPAPPVPSLPPAPSVPDLPDLSEITDLVNSPEMAGLTINLKIGPVDISVSSPTV